MIDDAVGLVPRGVAAAREEEVAVIGPLARHATGARARDVLRLRRKWPATAEHDLQNVTLWCAAAWPAAESAVLLAVNDAKINGPEMDTTDAEFLGCLPPADAMLRGDALTTAKACSTADADAEDSGGGGGSGGGSSIAKPWLIAVIAAAGVPPFLQPLSRAPAHRARIRSRRPTAGVQGSRS